LNRNHTKEECIKAVHLIKSCGITNISVDLIFSLPLQTIDNLQEDLNEIIALEINHVACYSLILEEKTVLSKWIADGKVQLLDNEVEAEMYQIVIDFLKTNGFKHYEISNFARNGQVSSHNNLYWKNETYYGFGMGASGYLNGVRYSNSHLVTDYVKKIEANQSVIETQEVLSKETILKEAMMLGLRLLDGVSVHDFKMRYQVDCLDYFKAELSYLKNQGWIEVDDYIRLSHQGLFYGNEVFGMFL
jgi:oxygen-independent coproporphyrinogen-3 oxidase